MLQSLQPVILTVEKELNLCEVLRFQLRRAGFRVLEAASGLQALGVLEQDLPDLIISEVDLPVMDGTQLLSAVRANPRTARIPLVFLTAKAELEVRLRAFELNANDYIFKPWDHRELEARVRALIRWNLRERPA